MSDEEKARAEDTAGPGKEPPATTAGTAAAHAFAYAFPCSACDAPARYELLPVDEGSLELPSYWCGACWRRAFRRAPHLKGVLRLLREQGAVRESGGLREFEAREGSPRAAGRGTPAVMPPSPPRREALFFGVVAAFSGGLLLWLAAAPPEGDDLSWPAFGALAVWAVLFGTMAARRWRRRGPKD